MGMKNTSQLGVITIGITGVRKKTKLNTALIEDTKLASLKKIFSDNPPIDPSWSKNFIILSS